MILAIFMIALAEVETGNDPLAVGRIGEVSRWQISQIALDEYNRLSDADELTMKHLKQEVVAEMVTRFLLTHYSDAYFNKYHKPINVRSLSIMWQHGYYWVKSIDDRKNSFYYATRVENLYLHYERRLKNVRYLTMSNVLKED